jgi:hypothetical protein
MSESQWILDLHGKNKLRVIGVPDTIDDLMDILRNNDVAAEWTESRSIEEIGQEMVNDKIDSLIRTLYDLQDFINGDFFTEKGLVAINANMEEIIHRINPIERRRDDER